MAGSEAALPARLRGHVQQLADGVGPRHLGRGDSLAAAAAYIEASLAGFGYRVASQRFEADGRPVRNLEVELAGTNRRDEIVVVGAHYDSVPGSPGANDNGSGVAALLEIARLSAGRPPLRTLRFVAFVNEEAPYFGSDGMGSLAYARRSKARGERIVAMLSLETLGYYSDAPGSQTYPPPLAAFYPSTGNFIGFVSNLGSRSLLRDAVASFRRHSDFPAESVAAPEAIPGIGWSDHWAFWQQGYPAIMITDTAPYRYPQYHTPRDTPEIIDYGRLAQVTAGLAAVVADLASPAEGER